MFSAKFQAVLLNVTGITYLVICLYNNIPKVLLYRKVFLQKNSFKGRF